MHFVNVKTYLNEAIATPGAASGKVVSIPQILSRGSETLDLIYFQGLLRHGAKMVTHCDTRSLYVLDSPW